jgi:hypothetical protein
LSPSALDSTWTQNLENFLFPRYAPDDPRYKTSWEWRRFLEHFVITLWHSCVSILESRADVDVCGPYLRENNHFSGNFWWAKCR